jgi:molybdopterin adenylyltransferase
MARVTAVCSCPTRGTAKKRLAAVTLIQGHGIEGDAHGGPGLCQVSMLSEMSLARMEQAGVSTRHGCCGENIDISAEMELHTLLPGVRLRLGSDAVVTLTSVGKDHADGHADRVIMGNIFPREGLFAEVLTGGRVAPHDHVELVRDGAYSAGVLTVSDSASRGEREDQSGPALLELLGAEGFLPARYSVVPDELAHISAKLRLWCEDGSLDLLLTTGGTGFSPRDVTPEATASVVDRAVPGIPEMIRSMSARTVPTAWLSRAVAGIRMGTLVVNLPGSRKAAVECAGFLLGVAGHALKVLRGEAFRCGG